MQRMPEVVISHYSYTEPAYITHARERGFTREHQAHDALASAKTASARPFTLSDLPQMLAGADKSVVDQVWEEMARLREVEDTYLNTLATAAWREAGTVNPLVLRPVRSLAENLFIAWSGGADAPAGWVMTWLEARAEGFPEERLIHATEMSNDRTAFNRAGPGETCLTVAGLIEAYTSEETHREFRLTPDKIQPYTTSGRVDSDTGEWDGTTVYWHPWAPDEVPEALPATMKDRF